LVLSPKITDLDAKKKFLAKTKKEEIDFFLL